MSHLANPGDEAIARYMRHRGAVRAPADFLQRSLAGAITAPGRLTLLNRFMPLAAAIALIAVAGLGLSARALLAPSGVQRPTPPVPPVPLLLQTFTDSGITLVPADSATLTAGDFEPIELGEFYLHGVSADGRTLAVLPFVRGNAGFVRIYDLASWRETRAREPVADDARLLTFAVDGSTVYWVEGRGANPTGGFPRGWNVRALAVGGGPASEVAELPERFQPREMRALDDGRLAVYGVATDFNGFSTSTARVVIAESESGVIAADLPLSGVTMGTERLPEEGPSRFESDEPATAWDLPAGLLYVVDAEAAALTTVDLNAATVSQQDIVPGSLPERLLSWLVPTARAKLLSGTDRSAALSPDGQRLFLTGMDRQVDDAADPLTYTETPLGLRVIGIDGRGLDRADLPVSELALSPDGHWLLMAGYSLRTPEGSGGETAGSGLYLADTANLEDIKHLEPSEMISLVGISFDSRYAYVLQQNRVDGPSRLRTLDLATGAFLSDVASPAANVLVIGGSPGTAL